MARKLTDLKTKIMERKQILKILTGHCAGVARTKENGLVATKVYLDDLADELVNLFAIHGVSQQSELLFDFVAHIAEQNEYVNEVNKNDIDSFLSNNCG